MQTIYTQLFDSRDYWVLAAKEFHFIVIITLSIWLQDVSKQISN